MPVDGKTIAAILGGIAVLVLAAFGVLQITTPEAAQCERERAAALVRVELQAEAIAECKTALKGGQP